MDNRDVALLVRAALAGDEEAFSTLVRQYQDYAYGVAIGLLSDFDLARDVVQEAFLNAYRDLGRLKDPARFGGWLRGIVRHTAFRALRELTRVRAMAEEFGTQAEAVDRRPTPARAVEEAEQHEIVRRALGKLNEKNREVVSLYYVNGFTYGDIAGFLGITEATVQGRLQRARARLREELKMVEGTFREKQLPEEFPGEIRRLLEVTAKRGRERNEAIRQLSAIGAAAVDPLCGALRDPRPPVRGAAARALCAIGDARALRPLLRVCYSDDDGALWDVYLQGQILSLPGVREELLRAARDAAYFGRWAAINALGFARGDDEARRCLLEIFRNKDEGKLRGAAMAALCRLDPGGAPAVITEALRDRDLHRRSGWAWWEAFRSGILVPLDACRAGFTRRVMPLNRWFAGCLVLRHGEEGRRVLEELLRTGGRDEKATAALALAAPGNREAFEILRQELIDGYQHRKWRNIIQRKIMEHYGREMAAWAEENLETVARHPGIAWCLARMRVEAGKGSAEDTLAFGKPGARAAMLRKFAEDKGAAFIPELREMLREGRPGKPAREAFRQMYRMGDAALPAVQEMFGSEHWTERKVAVCLLRRWGRLTPAQKARAEKDEHIAVRHAARQHHSRHG